MPAPVIAAIITAAATTGGTLYAAHKESEAANLSAAATRDATAAQTAANDKALAFQQQQAENAWRSGEADRQATYNQWRARENRISTAGQWLGLPGRDIPDYVPGIDPNFTGPAAPAVAAGAAPTAAGAPTAGAALAGMPNGIDPRLAAEYAKYHITPGAPGSGLSDWQYWNNKITTGDAGYFLGRLDSDLAGNGPDARGSSAAAAPRLAAPMSAGAYLAPSMQSTSLIAPALPLPMYRYSPGSYFA